MAKKPVPYPEQTAERATFEAWMNTRCEWYHNGVGGYHIRNEINDFFTADPGEEVNMYDGRVYKTIQRDIT